MKVLKYWFSISSVGARREASLFVISPLHM